MLNTMMVVDHELRRETPAGPSYYRYNEDGYGEHDDGEPFDGSGRGRLWPLLTGERGHLALQLGDDALSYLEAMSQMTGSCSLLPEQIWDSAPIPGRNLFPGRPTGSAMPLLWAHSEFLKLSAAIHRGRPIELLDSVVARYNYQRPSAAAWFWRADQPFGELPAGVDLVIEDSRPFIIEFDSPGVDIPNRIESTLGSFEMHEIRLTGSQLDRLSEITFVQQFADSSATNHAIKIGSASTNPAVWPILQPSRND